MPDTPEKPQNHPAPQEVRPENDFRAGQKKRALQEARARRKEIEQGEMSPVPEKGGRAGPDPARYGDWEVKGIASDF